MIEFAAFTIGVLTNTAVSIYRGFRTSDTFYVILAFIVLIGSISRNGNHPEFGFLFGMAFFSLVIALSFTKRILYSVTESRLLLYLLAASYLTATILLPKSELMAPLLAILVAATTGVAVLNFSPMRLPYWLQSLMTALYILASILIALSYFQVVYISTLLCSLCEEIPAEVSLLGMFLAGYMYFSLWSNIAYLLNFIPIPISKRQTFAQRLTEVRKHAEHLEHKYVDHDSHPGIVATVIALAAVMVWNGYAKFIPDELLVTTILVVGSLITEPRGTRISMHSNS